MYTQRLEFIKDRYNINLSKLRLDIDNYKQNYKSIFNEEYEIAYKNIYHSLIE